MARVLAAACLLGVAAVFWLLGSGSREGEEGHGSVDPSAAAPLERPAPAEPAGLAVDPRARPEPEGRWRPERVLPVEEIDVRVRVVDPEGAPVRGARVSGVRVEGGWGPWETCSNQGVGNVRAPVGQCERVRATADGFLEGEAPVDGRGERAIEVVIRLARDRVVAGTVVGPDGDVVDFATVVALDAAGGEVRRSIARMGSFRLDRLPPEPVRILAAAPAGDRAPHSIYAVQGDPALSASSAAIEVADAPRDLVLRVPPGASLTVRVEGWPAELVGKAWLTTGGARQGGIEASVREGVASVRGLRPDGSYALWVGGIPAERPGGPVRYVHRRGLRPGPEEIPVPVAEGGRIDGMVEGLLGSTAIVRLEGDGVLLLAGTDESGRFALEGLPPGEWTLWVKRPGLPWEAPTRARTDESARIAIR